MNWFSNLTESEKSELIGGAVLCVLVLGVVILLVVCQLYPKGLNP